MTTHLVFLRAINVSGHNRLKMEALTNCLTAMGFTNVQTYLQTGNVFVSTPETSAAKVGFIISQQIYATFGLDVPAIVINKNDLLACLKNNPFFKEKEIETKKLYVAFLSKELKKEQLSDLKMSQVKPDEAALDGTKIFIKYAVGAGKTRLDNKYIEKKLSLFATIRNWNTVTKLLEIWNSLEGEGE